MVVKMVKYIGLYIYIPYVPLTMVPRNSVCVFFTLKTVIPSTRRYPAPSSQCPCRFFNPRERYKFCGHKTSLHTEILHLLVVHCYQVGTWYAVSRVDNAIYHIYVLDTTETYALYEREKTKKKQKKRRKKGEDSGVF